MRQHPDQVPDQAPERAVQALLAAATSDGPPTTDLLHKVRRQVRRRRVLVPSLATLATAGVAAAVALAGPAMTGAPMARASARELVAAAVTRTAQEGYRVRITSTKVTPSGTYGSAADGVVDPARRTGRLTFDDGVEVRFVGGTIYRRVAPGSLDGFPGAAKGLRWLARPRGVSRLPEELDLGSRALHDPQQVLDRLRAAGDVRALGPATGDGWTGTRYGFALSGERYRVKGTVDVDGEGRVRRLELTTRASDPANGLGSRLHSLLEYRDFGADEPVTAPPADQVYRLGVDDPTRQGIKARREPAARR